MKKRLLCFLICLFCSFVSSAQEDAIRIIPDDATPGNGFGRTIALEADTLVVGAPEIDSVYVFTRADSAWEQTAKLTYESDNVYGVDVALSGDTMVVGDIGLGMSSGRVHIYQREGHEWKSVSMFEMGEDSFGRKVAIDGDTIIIGDVHTWGVDLANDEHFAEAGAVYITNRIDGIWTEPIMVSSPIAATYFNFGFTVAIDGETLFAAAGGSYNSNNQFVGAGIYVLNKNGTFDSFLEGAADVLLPQSYSGVLTLQDDHAALGIPFGTKGRVQVYSKHDTGWTFVETLTPNTTSNENFGSSVAVNGNRLVVGASFADTAYVYEYTEDGWEKLTRIENGMEDSQFGYQVAISGDTFAVSAPYTEDSGSVYLYELGN